MSIPDLLKNLNAGLNAKQPDLSTLTKMMGNVRSATPGSLATFRKSENMKDQLVKGNLVVAMKKYFALVVPKFFGPGKCQEAVWDFQRTTGLLANCTDASSELCRQVIDSELYKDILLYLDKYLSPEAQSDVEQKSIIWFICTLSNILVYVDARNQYRECRALEITCEYRKARGLAMVYIVESFIVQITDEAEVDLIYQTDHVIKSFLTYLRNCVQSSRKSVDIGTVSCRIIDVVLPVNQMCTNKSNLKRLVDNGVIQVYAHLLTVSSPNDEQELIAGLTGLWNICFEYKDEVKACKQVMDMMESLSKHKNQQIREKANGLLWTLNKEDDQVMSTFLRRETSALQIKEGKITAAQLPDEHIMMSYQWDHKDKIRSIKKKLQALGYKIWMDEDHMTGDLMEAMASAVENSFIVLVGVSRKYKESPNCRAEGRYAFKLGKKIIPLMLEYPYKGDGWLGLLTATDIFCKFTKDEDFDPGFERLVQEIRSKLGGGGPPSDSKELVKTAATKTQAAPPAKAAAAAGKAANWTQKDVSKWFKDNKLEKYQSNFDDADGSTLIDLKEVYEKSPDFFFGELLQSYGFQPQDKFKFATALKKLT